MRESDNLTKVASKTQLCGVLYKKPFGHQSNKWAKRFFVIKDGFLMYYPDGERKDFDKKPHFNVHPKGCIPLGGCRVESTTETGHPFSIRILSEDLSGHLVLGTDSEYDQAKWIKCILQSARITWNNAQISDAVIQQQEVHGLQMAREKQDYYDQLQNEATALHDERLKTEELERIREELEKEKSKMEQHAIDLKQQYSEAKGDVEHMTNSMKLLAEDKFHLEKTFADFQQNLEDLEKEKKKTLEQLKKEHCEAVKLSQEKKQMTEHSKSLQSNLKSIENRTQHLLEEKRLAEKKMVENKVKAQQLEEEKQIITAHAEELQECMKELAAQKATTEAELKVEVVARLEAERRLREAECSVQRLERDVMSNGDRDDEELRDEMIGDVRTLKRFFEKLAFEATIDANKPIMIKNAIHARKSIIHRAKTMKYELSRKRRSKGPVNLSATTPDLTKSGEQLIGFRHSSIDVTEESRDETLAYFSEHI